MTDKRNRVGKRVRGALYVHRSAVASLRLAARAAIERTEALLQGKVWTVAKLEEAVPDIVSLLDYEDFDAVPFPALRSSHRINLLSGEASSRNMEMTTLQSFTARSFSLR